jgi:hypothetical protein
MISNLFKRSVRFVSSALNCLLSCRISLSVPPEAHAAAPEHIGGTRVI